MMHWTKSGTRGMMMARMWMTLSALVTLTLTLTHVSATAPVESEYEPLPVPMPYSDPIPNKEQVGPGDDGVWPMRRRKRDVKGDLFDAAGSLGVGEKYIKKFRALVEGVPPKMQDALISQDFSNVTADDMRNLNISVIEYLPPKIIAKLNLTLLSPIVDRLLKANKPMAMGRVMTAMGDTMDSNTILDKLKDGGGFKDSNEEAANVLLYTALSKVGDKEGLDLPMINRLDRERLLDLVPEEQLMKVKSPEAARTLLQTVYAAKRGSPSPSPEHKDLDDQALIYKLAETSYGKAESWGVATLRGLQSTIVAQLPAQFLSALSPDTVKNSMDTLRDTDFGSPLQAKSVADVFMKAVGGGGSNGGNISTTDVGNMGNLAAFLNPSSVSNNPSILGRIVSSCDNLNLPAPLKAVSELLRDKLGGHSHAAHGHGHAGHSSEGQGQGQGRTIQQLDWNDFRDMSGALMKNAPPSVVGRAMELKALHHRHVAEIAGEGNSKGFFSNPFFKGIITQISSHAVAMFSRSAGGIGFRGLPAAFLGALGIKGIRDLSQRDITDDLPDKWKKNPDALDDAQKAMLLKRLRDQDMLNSTMSELPPELRALLPRKGDGAPSPQPGHGSARASDDILVGLPSDSELRLAYGYGRKFTAVELERDTKLIGTLTPKQVMDMNIEEIPAVLALVRESKDGPQQQTLAELSKRFAEYIRLKSEDYDSPDKKLLKYMSAAEVSKLPATVLAYFIDSRQTAKLPADVRKEIMIAMGELSTKDHAAIPAKTREEIILQGLAALDKLTGGGSSKKLDVTELAAIGGGVADLPPSRIASLTPVAAEQALEIIKGTADDDDDRLKQRSCLNKEQREAWRSKVIQLYGDPAKWDAPTVSTLCCILGLLNENDLVAILPDALATCRCASDSDPPSHLRELKKSLDANCKYSLGSERASPHPKATLDKVKSEIAFDLDDLESQIIAGRRRRRSDEPSESLTCFKVRIAGNAAHFSKEQLETLNPVEMKDCLYELGSEPLTHDNARVLWLKLMSTRDRSGGAVVLTPDDIRFAGSILSGIRLNDVNGLKLGDWDIVYPFGKTMGLTKNVLEKFAGFLEERQSKPLSQFDSNDLVITRNILCGFSPEKLSEIQITSFRDALPILNSLDPGCEQTRLAQLAGLTQKPEIFGPTSLWTPADVRGVGILLVGLSARSLESIPAPAFLGLSPSVAEALPPRLLEALSPAQVEYIPAFSAQAMTPSQRESLSDEARKGWETLVEGPLVSGGQGTKATVSMMVSIIFATIFAQRILL